MFKSLIDSIISIIPGFEAVTDASKYWDLMDTGDKNVDTKALQEQVATMSAEDLQKLKESFKEEQESTFGGLENAAAVMGIIASREKALQRHKGGPIKAAGIYKLLPNEMVLDNEATSLLVGVAKTLSGAALADLQRQSGQAQGMGTNVVIQNNNSTQMNSNASTVMPITPIQPSNSEQHYA